VANSTMKNDLQNEVNKKKVIIPPLD